MTHTRDFRITKPNFSHVLPFHCHSLVFIVEEATVRGEEGEGVL